MMRAAHNVAFPASAVLSDQRQSRRTQDEEPAVDVADLACGFIGKLLDLRAVAELEGTITARRLHPRNRRHLAMGTVKINLPGNIDARTPPP